MDVGVDFFKLKVYALWSFMVISDGCTLTGFTAFKMGRMLTAFRSSCNCSRDVYYRSFMLRLLAVSRFLSSYSGEASRDQLHDFRCFDL